MTLFCCNFSINFFFSLLDIYYSDDFFKRYPFKIVPMQGLYLFNFFVFHPLFFEVTREWKTQNYDKEKGIKKGGKKKKKKLK
ncbi:hypothetical protein BpHYR1_040926 [Brachionus plicatilis]|uniref:Uncharacterized protein n=1 Tax=Brachionus plicatilis TaxID=10195 RepID=A0A3M7SHI8_BRAPC|nr:hypothetical protein BpHYR1_040926 [Brachionus plicatilis]